MLKKIKIIVPLAVILIALLLPDANRAGPPLPPEAGRLTEDEQWLFWQKQHHQPRFVRPDGWKRFESTHFRFHYFPGTAAARDIHLIVQEAEQSLQRVATRLDLTYDGQLDIYLVDRVFWQGGAAYGSDEVLIAYLGRNYADVPFNYYLDHELAHVLAHSLLTEDSTTRTLLIEGLAVWAARGHYGPEPIHARAAALPMMGRAIPLGRLLDDFRNEPHEVAYLQGASFVGWLVEQHGLETFKAFYGAADSPERFYGASYRELERAWRQWLEQEWRQEREAHAAWLAARFRYFETMRAYQETFDPFARELPSRPSSWSVAERRLYRKQASTPENYALETQLIVASEKLACDNDPAATHALLDEIERAIEMEAIPPEGALARRFEVAQQLARIERGLAELDSTALREVAVPELHPVLINQMAALARYGHIQQALARLELEGEEATALVVWQPESGNKGRAFEMEFDDLAEGWRLEEKAAVQDESVIPRSNRLCRS